MTKIMHRTTSKLYCLNHLFKAVLAEFASVTSDWLYLGKAKALSELACTTLSAAHFATPCRDTIHSPDLRLGCGYRQPAASAWFSDTWRFHLCGRVQALCMPLILPRVLMHNACTNIPGYRYNSIRGWGGTYPGFRL